MDELGALILGKAPETSAKQPAGKSASVITDELLDSLRRVESGKDKFAVNKETKAMGPYQFLPETVQMLHKQGIEFNPFNEEQSRSAAKAYLEQLVQRNKGDVKKALADYGGFITKDPTAYVNKVTSGAQTQQTQQTPQAPQAVPEDDLGALILGKTQAKPQAQPQVQPSQAPIASPEQIPTGGLTAPAPQPTVRQSVEKFFQAPISERVAGAVDTLYGVVPATYGAGVQALARLSNTPERAEQIGQAAAATIDKPLGKALGITGKEAYQQPLGGITEPIAKEINRMFNVLGMTPEQISEKTGVPASDIRNMAVIGGVAVPQALKEAAPIVKSVQAAAKPIRETEMAKAPIATAGSLGAAAVPTETTIKQALSVASPELQKALSSIPTNKVNVPTLQRHIEADSLPVPVRLTEGQATGDIVKLSNEQNRRGKDPQLAQRFNEQNGQLVENIGEIRQRAAPDVYGTKTIENSQGIIDAYKALDDAKNTDIRAAYKALEDANGGTFPVDGVTLARNAEAMLGKKLKTEFLPSSIKSQLERFKNGEPMTFEQFEAMRTNLASEIRKAERSGDGNAATASSIVRQALEDLPMQGSAIGLKPLADKARTLAKSRFDSLKKDPAYKAAVDDTVPADKYLERFVVNGVNKNVQTMVENLGRNSEAHQHMAAGTINWLTDKAGIVDGNGNFSQAGYNKALKRLDDVKNVQEIFNPETASQLKTLGNVARYTQAQPRGAFVNNSNTLVGALAEKASGLAQAGVEKGLNVAVPGLQLGTSVMEMRARRAAEAKTKKALELGAGTKQTGKNKLSDM
jgi:hypothetical protein